MYWAASNTPDQDNERKDGGNKHHQDQDAPISGVSSIRDLGIKITDVQNGKPEEFLQVIKDFKTNIDGTETTSDPRKIQFLRTILCGEELREFDVIAGQIVSTKSTHIKQIKECWLC